MPSTSIRLTCTRDSSPFTLGHTHSHSPTHPLTHLLTHSPFTLTHPPCADMGQHLTALGGHADHFPEPTIPSQVLRQRRSSPMRRRLPPRHHHTHEQGWPAMEQRLGLPARAMGPASHPTLRSTVPTLHPGVESSGNDRTRPPRPP